MTPARRGAALLVVLAGCAPSPRHAPDAGTAAPQGTTVFSREAFAPPQGDAGAGVLPVPASADPGVLDEILAAAASPERARGPDGRHPHAADGGPPHPAGSGGGTPHGPDRVDLIGTDTGVASDAGAAAAPAPPDPTRSSKIRVGKVTVEPGMSSPTLERAARAQLYWPLTQRCRDRDGNILPAEVVRLAFHLDRDGYVVPATILALPREPRYADAARCMARELSMATFRAPAAARGLPHKVSMDVPSVD